MSHSGNEAFFDWPSPADPAREVWYSIVTHPAERLAFWYRYTLVRTADETEARVWAALSDARSDGIEDVFVSETHDLESVTLDDEPFTLELDGDNRLADDGASGSVTDGPTIEWSLAYDPDDLTFTPVRDEDQMREWAEQLGTGVHWSANQSVAMDGEVTVGGETIEFSAAPGHQGHTAGPSAPDDWVWTHCNAFEDREVSLEVLYSEERLSPACVRLPEGTFLLNRQDQVLGDTLETAEKGPDTWSFTAETDELSLSASVTADPEHWQLVSYLTPDGSLRYNAHCSLASVELTVETAAGERTYTSDSGRIEWVSTDRPRPGTYPPFDDERSAVSSSSS